MFTIAGRRMRHTETSCWVLATLAVALFTLHPTPPANAGIDVVVSTGDGSPDGNGTLSIINAPSINATGQLAFVSQLTGTAGGTADNLALYRHNSSGLALIARKGQSLIGRSILGLSPGSIDSAGTVTAAPVLTGSVVWHLFGDGTSTSPYFAPGSPSPNGNALLSVITGAVNDAGVFAFNALYNTPIVENGLYSRAVDGTVTTRLLRNDPLPRGGTVTFIRNRLTVNESAQIATVLNVDDDPEYDSIARLDGTTVHELVRTGDLAADGVSMITNFTSTTIFDDVPIPLINDAGQVAFPAEYFQPLGRLGVFLADDTGVRLVAPGTLPGGNGLVETATVVGLNSAGRVALTAEFSIGADPLSGVYLADTAGQTLVALEDSATPIPGKFFRSFFPSAATLNDAGQLAFLAELSDTVNGPAAGRGLFLYDPDRGLERIARTGDALAGSTITTVLLNGTVLGAISSQSPDTSLSGLNNAGQVAFAVGLANGQSHIAIWSADAGTPGDFNGDGTVDAADYTVWRDGLGTTHTPDEYDVWKSHFGQTGPGSGSASLLSGATAGWPNSAAPLPEPATILLFIAGLTLLIAYRPRPPKRAGRLRVS